MGQDSEQLQQPKPGSRSRAPRKQPESGIRALPGKRGLTLDEVSVGSYGEARSARTSTTARSGRPWQRALIILLRQATRTGSKKFLALQRRRRSVDALWKCGGPYSGGSVQVEDSRFRRK